MIDHIRGARQWRGTVHIFASAVAAVLVAAFAPILRAQWISVQPSGFDVALYGVNFPTRNVGYAVGWGVDGSVILKTTDGGGTWNIQEQPGALFFSAYFSSPDTGMVAGYLGSCNCGMIARTEDGGATWNTGVADGSTGFYSLSFAGTDTGFVCGYDGFIMKTTDRGVNWRKVKTGTSDVFRRIFMADARVGFATAGLGRTFNQPGQLYKTTDAGEHWTRIQDFSGSKVLGDLWFTSPDVGYFVGHDGREAIYKTTDGGTTWDSVYHGAADEVLQGVIFASPTTGYAVGTNSRILRTTDAGGTWHLEALPASAEPLVGVGTTGDNVFATGLGGTILRRTSALGVNVPAAAIAGIRIAPNPLATSATVTVPGSTPGDAFTFEIVDLGGTVVRRVEGRLSGSQFTLERDGLAGGTYVYRLRTSGGDAHTGRIVVQ